MLSYQIFLKLYVHSIIKQHNILFRFFAAYFFTKNRGKKQPGPDPGCRWIDMLS